MEWSSLGEVGVDRLVQLVRELEEPTFLRRRLAHVFRLCIGGVGDEVLLEGRGDADVELLDRHPLKVLEERMAWVVLRVDVPGRGEVAEHAGRRLGCFVAGEREVPFLAAGEGDNHAHPVEVGEPAVRGRPKCAVDVQRVVPAAEGRERRRFVHYPGKDVQAFPRLVRGVEAV